MKPILIDFQGWPVYAMNVEDIVLSSGGIKDSAGNIRIPINLEGLELKPQTLEDDGMGYGVNEKLIRGVNNLGTKIEITLEKPADSTDAGISLLDLLKNLGGVEENGELVFKDNLDLYPQTLESEYITSVDIYIAEKRINIFVDIEDPGMKE